MVSEHRSFRSRQSREPTFAEVREARRLEAEGVADVYVAPDAAPVEFWRAARQASYAQLLPRERFSSGVGVAWWSEFRWQHGWPEHPDHQLANLFELFIADGGPDYAPPSTAYRFAAIENLIDVVDNSYQTSGFKALINEAAMRFRVGIRLEGSRFVDVTSEEVHREVVQPALSLLADTRFERAETLYRKGYERLFAGDSPGVITAATSAVQEMLTIGGAKGSTLQPLAKSARAAGWIGSGEEQQIIKLEAFRGDGDAQKVGTDDEELARLVLHLCAGLLLYLGRTMRPDDSAN